MKRSMLAAAVQASLVAPAQETALAASLPSSAPETAFVSDGKQWVPSCTDCTAAADRTWHGFAAGCEGCAARAVARGHNFARVRKQQRLDRGYRAELELLGVTHEQVKAAHAADAYGKATA